MTTSLSIGGTANIRAIDATNFVVAMTGVLDGGVCPDRVHRGGSEWKIRGVDRFLQ